MTPFKYRFTLIEIFIYWVSLLQIGLSIGGLFFDLSRQFSTIVSFCAALLMLVYSLTLMRRAKIPKESFLLHLILAVSLFLFTFQTGS